MSATDRSNEGRACDAVLGDIEARIGAPRRDLIFPEKTHGVGPVELVCTVGTQRFAFEHTRIEPFAGHIQLEAEAKRHVERRDRSRMRLCVGFWRPHRAFKAAQQLGVSTAAVSEVIAGLEHALGVRLLDRNAQGIEPTIFGGALLKRSVAAFDELKQSIRDIEFLSDPTVGEVRVACMESLWYTLLPEVILRFSERYPRIEVHAELVGNARDFPGLRERKYDCLLQRAGLFEQPAIEELNVETLFDDTVVIAAGANSRWAHRRKIELAELIDEPWIFGAPDTWHHARAEEMFRARGLSAPRPRITTVSIVLRARLLAAGPYLTTLLTSVMQRMRADHYAVTALPVDLPGSTAAQIVTLKNRTLSPVVERFLICVREVAASFAGKPAGRVAPSPRRNVS